MESIPLKKNCIGDLELLHIFNLLLSHQCCEKRNAKKLGFDLADIACSAIYRYYFELKPEIAVEKLLTSYITLLQEFF